MAFFEDERRDVTYGRTEGEQEGFALMWTVLVADAMDAMSDVRRWKDAHQHEHVRGTLAGRTVEFVKPYAAGVPFVQWRMWQEDAGRWFPPLPDWLDIVAPGGSSGEAERDTDDGSATDL